MKQSAFIIFISIVLLIYTSVNYYLFVKGYRLLPDKPAYKYSYIILFLFFALQFIISRILLVSDVSIQPKFIFELGGLWFAAVLYFLIIAFLAFLTGIFDKFFHFLPDLEPFKFKILLSVTGGVCCILIAGYINAISPSIKTVNLKIEKKSPIRNLKIAMVSDIHFGTIIGYHDIEKMFRKIESEKPDILLVAGDFTDEGVTKRNIDEIKSLFVNFQPKYGKYAILGNHEYYNRIERTIPVFEQLNLILLRDSSVNIENKFVLVGRDDITVKSMQNKDRKSIQELIRDMDTNLPIILLDHQPYKLGETAKHPIDLQLSGHTHHGQLFPMNFLTKAIYEVSWGYKKKENTHFYVSCGYGTWGPRVRLGNTPEIVIVNLEFELK